MKRSFLFITIFILTISCGNTDNKNDGRSGSIFKTEINSPCEILTEAEIKDALEIPADAVTTIKEIDRLYSMCKYKWETVTFSMVASIGKTTKSIDFPSEMNITISKDMSNEQYEESISFYDDAKSQDGIGEIATWSAKKRQVTFLSDGYLVHVYLRTSSDEAVNKKQVIKVAKLIDGKI